MNRTRAALFVVVTLAIPFGSARGGDPVRPNTPIAVVAENPTAPDGSLVPTPRREEVLKTAQTVALFALLSLAPAAALMVTSFVRINIVLTLLRQALGSPQVPGNQVLMALALMLTVLVMKPHAEAVYTRAIEPYAAGRASPAEAFQAGSVPIKNFMIDQIRRTGHENYLWTLYDRTTPAESGRADPTYYDEFPLRIVAPAFLLSELTTALVIGFKIYLPFLAVDLVVSAVLAAMGLVMLPPSLVSLPLKLILFVLADGWLLVADMLLKTFGTGAD